MEVHEEMRSNPDWKQQFFMYFKDIIKHKLPDMSNTVEPGYEPHTQHPPDPDNDNFANEFVQSEEDGRMSSMPSLSL